jgi:hypothetical protein
MDPGNLFGETPVVEFANLLLKHYNDFLKGDQIEA